MRGTIPPIPALALMTTAHAAAFAAVPILVSTGGARHGWSEGRPGSVNLAVGVPILGAGVGIYIWTVANHMRAAAPGWRVALTPDYLTQTGPYRLSRNPMYVGQLTLWAGWAALFGSLPVTAGLAGWTAVVNGLVRWEERSLHQRWGAPYDGYRQQVPRWGRLHRLGSRWSSHPANSLANESPIAVSR
ncbi:isoprenylcysteine carboxylmethyltransferase family protein [Nocardia huaxiensis]|uniref:Isoprenylcysteine carboxylmethyltransferase family protein n=1 Tax=Nocardia huaxiensis TaxID=2755382 RepID=A0A7D6Z3A4_9NOCA|nr:isoprenylcysteine carboxylmethyltransferase family protein [Nocardia huaxiensis]QLY29924.1 isoprenylcysteine carboxylmethyltransferase family protein [Nocardia huaxiensis]